MILKLIVLVLVIGIVCYGFKRIGRHKIDGQADEEIRDRIENEEMLACDICGTFVTARSSNCGQERCPF